MNFDIYRTTKMKGRSRVHSASVGIAPQTEDGTGMVSLVATGESEAEATENLKALVERSPSS